MTTDLQEFAPASLLLRELQPKRVRGEFRRRWFNCARSDLIVWLRDDGSTFGFQFCYDKDFVERALTWMPGRGFSHMRVDSGAGGYGDCKGTPLLVPDGHFDPAYILEVFSRDSEARAGGVRRAGLGKAGRVAARRLMEAPRPAMARGVAPLARDGGRSAGAAVDCADEETRARSP